jgi:peptide/nickel transport system substrate-binding protein
MSERFPLPSRREFLVFAASLGLGSAMGGGLLAACSSTPGGAGLSDRQQTLFVAGHQFSPPTTFNPLNASAAWPCARFQAQLIYESLFTFNVLDGSLRPQLATSVDTVDAQTLRVTLAEATQWQDGKPLTADDVVFTFELGKRHAEVPFASVWDYLAAVTKVDDRTVTFTLNPAKPNPGLVRSYLTNVLILPAHMWTDIESQNAKLAEYANLKPVGSGPYTLDSQNAQQIVLARYDKYWGQAVRHGLPAPKRVVHPVFKDNSAGDLAFERGELDVSQNFTPQIWKMWQDKKKPVGTWLDKAPYYIPGSIPMLTINTTKPGLNNARVRVALAHAIDYARIASTAMSEYSEPARSSVILPRGSEGKYFDQANVDANGWKHDTAKAVAILEGELGAKKGGDGIYVLPDGTRLGPWKAQCPTGWSDWQAALQIVAESAKAVGIDIVTYFPKDTQYRPDVQNGNYDLALYAVSLASPASPWERFRDVLDDRGVPPLGQPAFQNFGRFSHAEVAGLLDQAAVATGDAIKQAYAKLDRIFMANAPMIPLMYRPLEFYEFNKSVWEGFPDSANPYAPPMYQGAGIDWLYKIKPKTT